MRHEIHDPSPDGNHTPMQPWEECEQVGHDWSDPVMAWRVCHRCGVALNDERRGELLGAVQYLAAADCVLDLGTPRCVEGTPDDPYGWCPSCVARVAWWLLEAEAEGLAWLRHIAEPGKFPAEGTETCPACNGEGATMHDTLVGPQEERCDNCDGDGWVLSADRWPADRRSRPPFGVA